MIMQKNTKTEGKVMQKNTKKWKPKEGDVCWDVSAQSLVVAKEIWVTSFIWTKDFKRDFGTFNCFRTRKEAVEAKNKIIQVLR